MFTRRQLLIRTLKGSSLLALGSIVPRFLVSTAQAAEPGQDTVLVVLEMTGGNDGLNTVVPYADDNYHRVRPTLRLTREQVIRVNDQVGLNPGMNSLRRLLEKGELAIVQGVGYPNPDRSHFESMDIWQSADVTRKTKSGWLGRGMGSLFVPPGHLPGINIGREQLPLALQGSATVVPSIHPGKPYDLELASLTALPQVFDGRRVIVDRSASVAMPSLGPEKKELAARRQLVEDLARLSPAAPDSMLQFTQRSALQTYATIDRLRKVMEEDQKAERLGSQAPFAGRGELARNLSLIGSLIAADFGTRVYYASIGGFDTHANQMQQHQQLLQQVADAVAGFFAQLERTGHAQRVLVMTFSEFGRRVDENGSRGTDHGAASCLFVAGPSARGGVVGKHPSLAPADLLAGDLKHEVDFRQVYATLLDRWLVCDSRKVLGERFEHLPLLRQT